MAERVYFKQNGKVVLGFGDTKAVRRIQEEALSFSHWLDKHHEELTGVLRYNDNEKLKRIREKANKIVHELAELSELCDEYLKEYDGHDN